MAAADPVSRTLPGSPGPGNGPDGASGPCFPARRDAAGTGDEIFFQERFGALTRIGRSPGSMANELSLNLRGAGRPRSRVGTAPERAPRRDG